MQRARPSRRLDPPSGIPGVRHQFRQGDRTFRPPSDGSPINGKAARSVPADDAWRAVWHGRRGVASGSWCDGATACDVVSALRTPVPRPLIVSGTTVCSRTVGRRAICRRTVAPARAVIVLVIRTPVAVTGFIVPELHFRDSRPIFEGYGRQSAERCPRGGLARKPKSQTDH